MKSIILPSTFTEYGLIMTASVLNIPRVIAVVFSLYGFL